MKIKTITCSNAENHGARLQAFALAEFLYDEGHNVEVIDYQPDYMRFGTKKVYFPGTDIKEWVKLFLRYRQRCTAIERHDEFDKFSGIYIPLTQKTYLTNDMLAENPPKADVYIAGSDQIWNVDFPNGNDKAFFLDFGNDKIKRLSYAASFALPKLPKDKEQQIARWLSRFDAISVRESSGLNILHKLGLEGIRVVDPVFLVSPACWKGIANSVEPPAESHSRYLLVYDFMKSDVVKSVARKIAGTRNLKIYSVGPYPVRYADRNFTVCSPETFVRLILDADCVLSNSFHATAFSLIFEKDLFVADRNDGLNERMHDIMNVYGLTHNIVNDKTSPEIYSNHIAYDKITPVITADIEKSKTWLRTQLTTSHSGE